MADILIKNIDEKTLNNLSKNAKLNNRTLEEECKSILETHGKTNIDEVRKMVRETLEKYRSEGRTFSDSTVLIREDRER